MEGPERNRGYIFTINNCTENDIEILIKLIRINADGKTLICQDPNQILFRLEENSDGTYTLHGYIYFKGPRSLNSVIGKFNEFGHRITVKISHQHLTDAVNSFKEESRRIGVKCEEITEENWPRATPNFKSMSTPVSDNVEVVKEVVEKVFIPEHVMAENPIFEVNPNESVKLQQYLGARPNDNNAPIPNNNNAPAPIGNDPNRQQIRQRRQLKIFDDEKYLYFIMLDRDPVREDWEYLNIDGSAELEITVQRQIEIDLDGRHQQTLIGQIDVLSATIICEIKIWSNWMDALGKILAYGTRYPRHKKWIHFFGPPPSIKMIMRISAILRSHGITMSYE